MTRRLQNHVVSGESVNRWTRHFVCRCKSLNLLPVAASLRLRSRPLTGSQYCIEIGRVNGCAGGSSQSPPAYQQFPGKLDLAIKNAKTAISLEAFITAGNVPPISPAPRARFKSLKLWYRGAQNSSFYSSEKSRGGNEFGTRILPGHAHPIGEGTRSNK